MLKRVLLLTLSFSLLMSEAPFDRSTLSNHDIMMTTESYDLYDSEGKVLRLYQKRGDGEKRYLLSFVLSETIGGCEQKSIEQGSYEVNGSRIIFYTLWDRRGSADAPYGARIKIYSMEEGEGSNSSQAKSISRLKVEVMRRRVQCSIFFPLL